MALREKFGRLVLLEETESDALGREYRAARLGPDGLDRLVTVLRFGPAVSSHSEATRRLMEEARLAARLSNPALVRVLGIGRVEQSFYVSTELVEGRSLAAILARCRDEAVPFAASHALMTASRAAAGLEFLHGKKDDAGSALAHGLVAPSRIVVAFDGEVKVKGLGLWPALRGTGLLPPEERRYLAPEQADGAAGDPRSDVYALGLVLLEVLAAQAPDGTDPLDRLADAVITNAVGEKEPLPKLLADLLRRALGREPATRFAGMADLRKAVDALVFSGDFAPTTFDLAFFMHTLFRREMERESRALEEARGADYREFLAEDKSASVALPSPGTEPETAPGPPPPPPSTGDVAALAEPVTQVAAPTPVDPARTSEPERMPRPVPRGPDSSGARAAALRASREAAARMTLGSAAPTSGSRRGLWLLLGLLGAGTVGGGAGWLYFVRVRGLPTPPPTTLSAKAVAAEARVRELEERIAQLEREKAQAEAGAAEEARRTLETQAAAGGKAADPAAVVRAQEEARRRARAEQERKQQDEMQRLAEQRSAEVQRLKEASPAPTPPAAAPVTTTPAAASTPTPLPEATPSPLAAAAGPPAVASTSPAPTPPAGASAPAGTAAAPPTTSTPAPGSRPADPSDPGVKPPVLVSEEPLGYPVRAVGRRIATSVVVRALVDEQGRVVEAAVVQASGQPPELGFDETALKRVRSRRYRPARRNDVPVSIWVVVRVDFRPPPPRF